MKVHTLAVLSMVAQAKAGCPFSGTSFSIDGAAPAFTDQENFTAPFSQCDQHGNCTIPIPGHQFLEGNDINSGPSAKSFGLEECIDSLPPPTTGYESCKQAAAAWGGCKEMKALGACNRTCATCSPVFVSQFGRRSGTPYDIDQDEELAIGGSFYLPKIPRKRCKPYDVGTVVNAAREIFKGKLGNIAASVRMGFHDAGDFDKWTLTGGADGRFATSPEAWYGQSRSTNKGLLCVHQLLGKFASNPAFQYLSNGDAVHICAMVAVEIAGGPKFEQFNFLPGRITGEGVTNDGMLPNPNGNNVMLRDYFYRMGLSDIDIVALMGAHTLGGGAGGKGSGYTMNFTPNSGVFDNTFYKQLVKYIDYEGGNCNYFAKKPSQRGVGGGCHVGAEKNLLQLPTDRALMLDASFATYVRLFAKNQNQFFNQFAHSMKKLSELGKDTSVQWCSFD